MSERIVHISRSKVMRALHRLYEEIDPQFLIDSERKIPSEWVDKFSRGVRTLSNDEEKYRRNRERESIPYRSRGVSPVLAMEWVKSNFGLDALDNWLSMTYGVDQFEIDDAPRYSKRKETSGGGWSHISEEERKRYTEANARIDARLARGENPFRPEKSRRHPSYFYR